jgi:CRP-like cAMP-binding protein
MKLLDIMKRVELFRGLDESQLERITAISTQETLTKDTKIFNQGDSGDKMYIISQGQVEVRVRGADGESRAALYLGIGQVFGEMALIDSGPRSAAVVAVDDDTVIYSIPTDDFTNLCQTDTGIGYIMMRNIAQDLSFKLRHRDFDPSQG